MTDIEFDNAIVRIRQGDKNGLAEIYEAYIGLIYAIVKDVVKDKESAEDVTSDFFIRLWDKADKYQPGHGHKTWITTVARNMAIDHVRKYSKEEVSDLLEDLEYTGYQGQNASPDNPVESQVLDNVTIQEALALLQEKERQILNMKILGEMTFQEIADTLRVPMGTVTWRYRNAVNKLRRCGYGTGF